VDADSPLEDNGTEWLPVTQAGRGRAWDILFVQVPEGAADGIVIDDLGARMKLIRNRWYVDSKHVNLDMAGRLPQVARFTCLQWAAGLTIIIFGIIFILMDGDISGEVALLVAAAAGLMLLADYLIQRRFS
jgi:hypothetical protein